MSKGDMHDCPVCEKNCIQCKCPKPLPVAQWCKCEGWTGRYWTLQNHDKMNFCGFCGERLQKTTPTT